MLLDTDDCIIWPYGTSNGYGRFLYEGRMSHVHAVACERGHGPPPPGYVACHGPCHTPLCFNPRHVSWGTARDNSADRERDGTVCRGEQHPQSVLTEADVIEIRLAAASGVRFTQMAGRYGVTSATIGAVVHLTTWKHVT